MDQFSLIPFIRELQGAVQTQPPRNHDPPPSTSIYSLVSDLFKSLSYKIIEAEFRSTTQTLQVFMLLVVVMLFYGDVKF